jgi:hypothetical protein
MSVYDVMQSLYKFYDISFNPLPTNCSIYFDEIWKCDWKVNVKAKGFNLRIIDVTAN